MIPKMNFMRWFCVVICFLYNFCLPLLAKINFAEPGSESVSAFISNAHATGAMAALSYVPFSIIQEYQNYYINKISNKRVLVYSQWSFFFFYGMFLTCTVNYLPVLHTFAVSTFGISFIVHSILVLKYVLYSKISRIFLTCGIFSFVSLLFVKGMNFWLFECIGFACMVLFTPLEIINTKFEEVVSKEMYITLV